MTLLHQIFTIVGPGADLTGFTRYNDSLGKSLVAFMVNSSDRKEAIGLFKGSPTAAGGNYAGCREALYRPAEFERVRAYFHAMGAGGS